MTYMQEWRRLSAHIRGLSRAVEINSGLFKSTESWRPFSGQCLLIHKNLSLFVDQHTAVLPQAFNEAFARLSAVSAALLQPEPLADLSSKYTFDSVIMLIIFEVEATFALSGQQEEIRSRSELAFIHLARLIAVDLDVNEKWIEAQTQETDCEALGSVHLLQHGIFAFKVNASGARTDLVFPDKSFLEPRHSNGLILTEWKVASNEQEANKKLCEAMDQAKRYSVTVLAAAELRSVRFLIVVTPEQVAVPEEQLIDGIIYRCINIAVQPLSPSLAARKAVATKRRLGKGDSQ